MNVGVIRHHEPVSWGIDRGSEAPGARPGDAQLAIKELEILRGDVDLVNPNAVAGVSDSQLDRYRGAVTSGDHLRLDQRTRRDGPAIRAAITRILAVDTSSGGASADAVLKEAKMRRVLVALDYAAQFIRHQATGAPRGGLVR